MKIDSEPQGAIVYLNGEEVGRTPMTQSFLWYGTYDLQLRKEGYRTRSESAKVWAPLWQIPPIDLFAELTPLPLEDRHELKYALKPLPTEPADAQAMIARSRRLRGRLITSQHAEKTDEAGATSRTSR